MVVSVPVPVEPPFIVPVLVSVVVPAAPFVVELVVVVVDVSVAAPVSPLLLQLKIHKAKPPQKRTRLIIKILLKIKNCYGLI
jgi:hypothetical protein